MELKLKLYKPFVTELNRLKEKYGEKFEKLNGFHNINLNFSDFIDNFVKQDTLADTTIDANANNSMKDVSSMIREMSKPHQKLLAYNKIYYEMVKKYDVETANSWLEKEWNGTFYLHNAHTTSYYPYCFSYSLKDVAEKGLFFLGRFKTIGAQHLSTFNHHVLEFLSYVTNRTSGAAGLGDYLVYSYYFYIKDIQNKWMGITEWEKYRDQQFQVFIYNINQPYLRISESAFTNISIYDREYLTEVFGDKTFPDGSFMIDHIEELIEYQKAFMNKVSAIRKENMFTFPVLSFNLLYKDGEFKDREFARWASDHNTQWYDSNFLVNDDPTISSQCCRIVNKGSVLDNKNKKLGFINSIGGSSLKVGSIQVNTINLMRIALETKEGGFSSYIDKLKDDVAINLKVLDVIRSIMKRNIEKGLLPIYNYNLVEMERQFNTIGITAMSNAIEYLGGIKVDELGNKSYTQLGVQMAKDIMDTINTMKDEFDCDYSINVENVPGESANVKLCKKDTILYGVDKVNTNMYANQWVALTDKCTNSEKIRLSSILDKECGGGQILHVNIESGFNNKDQAWENLNTIASSGVIYFAYNPKISACEHNHAFFGEICPQCGGKKVETYSKIVGFLVPYSSFSKQRKEEFNDRHWYDYNYDSEVGVG